MLSAVSRSRFDVKTNIRGKHDFLESECPAVRDRQMCEVELEDDLLNRDPARYANNYPLWA